MTELNNPPPMNAGESPEEAPAIAIPWTPEVAPDPFQETRKPITEESGIQKEWYVETEKFQTLDDLTTFLKKIMNDYNHDYGTICHAIVAGMIGTMNVINRSSQGGITGFQASCLTWELIDRMHVFDEGPKRMVCFSDMLYPQMDDKFSRTISPSTWEWLQKRAKENIEKESIHGVHPKVHAHWESIVSGTVPFGFTVKTKEG